MLGTVLVTDFDWSIFTDDSVADTVMQLAMCLFQHLAFGKKLLEINSVFVTARNITNLV